MEEIVHKQLFHHFESVVAEIAPFEKIELLN